MRELRLRREMQIFKNKIVNLAALGIGVCLMTLIMATGTSNAQDDSDSSANSAAEEESQVEEERDSDPSEPILEEDNNNGKDGTEEEVETPETVSNNAKELKIRWILFWERLILIIGGSIILVVGTFVVKDEMGKRRNAEQQRRQMKLELRKDELVLQTYNKIIDGLISNQNINSELLKTIQNRIPNSKLLETIQNIVSNHKSLENTIDKLDKHITTIIKKSFKETTESPESSQSATNPQTQKSSVLLPSWVTKGNNTTNK